MRKAREKLCFCISNNKNSTFHENQLNNFLNSKITYSGTMFKNEKKSLSQNDYVSEGTSSKEAVLGTVLQHICRNMFWTKRNIFRNNIYLREQVQAKK